MHLLLYFYFFIRKNIERFVGSYSGDTTLTTDVFISEEQPSLHKLVFWEWFTLRFKF